MLRFPYQFKYAPGTDQIDVTHSVASFFGLKKEINKKCYRRLTSYLWKPERGKFYANAIAKGSFVHQWFLQISFSTHPPG